MTTPRETLIAKMRQQVERLEAQVEYLNSDETGNQIDKLIEAYQSAHPEVSYEKALYSVLASNPELAKALGTEMNPEFAQANPSVDFSVRG